MIVLDASALADWLLATPGRADAVAEEIRLARGPQTLDFADIEVLSALRRKAARGELSPRRARQSIDVLATLPLRRHPAAPLRIRVWELRDSHSAYDAAYVALAEALEAPLLTTDAGLARSRGHRALITLAQ